MHSIITISVFIASILGTSTAVPIRNYNQAQNRTFLPFPKESNLQWKGNFTWIQGADSQFGLIKYFQNDPWSLVNNTWEQDIHLLNLAIQEWNALNPKFVTICGDLVNDYPGDKNRRTQLNDFKNSMNQLNQDIPLVLLGGNHDFLNIPTHQSVQEYKSEFGDDYYSFWVGGVMFLVLNVQYYKNSTGVEDLYQEQEKWLDVQLKESVDQNATHLIVLQHIPWFLNNITEPEDKMWTIAQTERDRIVPKLYSAGVRFIFAGHYHQNAYGHYKDLQMITSSAIGAQSPGGNAKSGYRVVDVTKDLIEHRYVNINGGMRDNPNWAWTLMMSGVMFGYLRLFV